MRFTRCGLLRYRTLQHVWQPTAASRRATQTLPASQSRVRTFSGGLLCQDSPFVESFFSTRSHHDALTNHPPEENEDDILARARAYNILSAEQLSFESDVMHNSKRKSHMPGIRLVDRRQYAEDFYLWTILLDWQKLKHGDRGVRLIWEGLKFRCGMVDLPFVGYQGDKLWSAFVDRGCRHNTFLSEVIRYEISKGCKRPGFFAEVVGALMNSKHPSSAKKFARVLQVAHRPRKDELFDLFVVASNAQDRSCLQLFCDIYSAMPSSSLYEKVVAHLCRQERFSDAWVMHRYLLNRDDLPKNFDDIKPLIMDLVNNHMRLDSFLHELTRYGISMNAQANSFWAQERSLRLGFSSENMNIVSSRTLGVQPRSLSDGFAARAFLTASFSFDNILGGLRFFGLKSVGPSSLRAMGLTSSDSQDLRAKLAKLAELEIDTGSSRFARLVKQLADEGKDTLLQDVLRSDQHADVFEDLSLQRRLLQKYYQDGDQASVDRTLAVLTVSSRGERAQEESANFLLRAALSAGNWTHVRQIIAEICRNHHHFDEASIARMYDTVLSRRIPGKPPLVHTTFDDLGFLVSIWLQVLSSGSKIRMLRWKEPIRRLGMSGRLDELEILLVRLLQYYGTEQKPPKGIYSDADIQKTNLLLSCELQAAIVAWGFIHTRHLKPVLSTGSPFGTLKQAPWTRGIRFLRSLKERHGCDIDVGVMRQACLVRLRQLFNHRTESGLTRNRRSFSRNRLPLWSYLESLESAWREPLFPDKQQFWNAVTIQAPVTSRQKRRVGARELFGKHARFRTSPVVGLKDHTTDQGKDKEHGQDTDVVFHGGPLSQAYWSSRQ